MFPYSDGSPLYEAAVAVSLVAGFAVVGMTRARHGFDQVTRRLAAGLRDTGIFSGDISLSAEVYRLDLLRIVIGMMATFHYAGEWRIAMGSSNALWFGFTAACCGLVTVGLATPIAVAALLVSLNILVVNYTLNVSIGSLAIAMCLIPMAIAPGGHTLSIDALLLCRRTPMTTIYRVWGAPTVDRIQIGRFLALLAFAAINVYSALQHLESQTWRDGLTVATILLFPVINREYHQIADAAYASAPVLYIGFSKLATWGMLVWQLLMVPLALSRWTRPIVICWGIVFFIFSAHVLAIKTLGIYEYALFAIVFWSRAFIDNTGRHGLEIYFDDRCNLCDRTVRTLAAIDLFHRLAFRPLSQNIAAANARGVSEEEAMTDLVGVTPAGRAYRGYELYLHISATVLLAMPLWPILIVGRVTRIGPASYRFIADRRRRLFGVCQIGTHKPRQEWTSRVERECSVLASAIALCFLVLLAAYVVRLPPVSVAAPALAEAAKYALGRAPLAFGIGHIDVFNEYDLKLYRTIPFTYLLMPDGSRQAIRVQIGEAGHYRVTQDLRDGIRFNKPCVPNWTEHWAEFVRLGTTETDPVRNAKVMAEFKVATRPSREDMLAFRYHALTWSTVCEVAVPVLESAATAEAVGKSATR